MEDGNGYRLLEENTHFDHTRSNNVENTLDYEELKCNYWSSCEVPCSMCSSVLQCATETL